MQFISGPDNRKKVNSVFPHIDTYPFRNKSLNDMHGEVWKEVLIPELEDNILLSNYGRVKSLERLVARRNNKWTIKPEKILSPFIQKNVMKRNDIVWTTVGICIGYNKKFYNLLISRWLYYLYVEPFDMKNKDLVITFKDSDNSNLHLDNLLLSTRGTEVRRSFARGDRERGAFNTIPQKIIQLNENNEIINRFPSINQASQFFEIDSKTIWGMLKGKFKNKFNLRYED